jgi:glycosyltransferase involved in cell wall biosynthesis
MSEPTVSVILTTLNEEDFIENAIDAIVNQTFQDFEIIVVDGGSTDSTCEIIRSYDDDRITLVERQGLAHSPSLNVAIDIAKRKYIAKVDPDDISRPERLQKQVQYLDDHPEVGVLGVAYHVEDRIRGETYTRHCPTDDATIRREMTKYIPILHSGVMFRREAVVEAGLYDATIDDIEDLELWIRVGQRYNISNLDEVLVDKVVRPESAWHSSYGLGERTFQHSRMNFKAARMFSVPRYYYIFPFLRLVYAILPTQIKRIVRRWMSKLREHGE